MIELDDKALCQVQGGILFVPIAVAFIKGAATGAGYAALGIAVADLLDVI